MGSWNWMGSDEEAGPAPPPGKDKPKKKRKVLEFQHVYLDNLPCATMYERSFMHQNNVTHVEWTKSNFLVTASSEGHVKFWKKKAGEIEFIKRYCAHLGPVSGIAAAKDGVWLATISSKDCVANIFDGNIILNIFVTATKNAPTHLVQRNCT